MKLNDYWKIIDGLKAISIAGKYMELSEILKGKSGRELFHFHFITTHLLRYLRLCDMDKVIQFLYREEYHESMTHDVMCSTILKGSKFYGKIITNPYEISEEDKLSLEYGKESLYQLAESVAVEIGEFSNMDTEMELFLGKGGHFESSIEHAENSLLSVTEVNFFKKMDKLRHDFDLKSKDFSTDDEIVKIVDFIFDNFDLDE